MFPVKQASAHAVCIECEAMEEYRNSCGTQWYRWLFTEHGWRVGTPLCWFLFDTINWQPAHRVDDSYTGLASHRVSCPFPGVCLKWPYGDEAVLVVESLSWLDRCASGSRMNGDSYGDETVLVVESLSWLDLSAGPGQHVG